MDLWTYKAIFVIVVVVVAAVMMCHHSWVCCCRHCSSVFFVVTSSIIEHRTSWLWLFLCGRESNMKTDTYDVTYKFLVLTHKKGLGVIGPQHNIQHFQCCQLSRTFLDRSCMSKEPFCHRITHSVSVIPNLWPAAVPSLVSSVCLGLPIQYRSESYRYR